MKFHCNMMRHCFMNSGGVNPIDGFIFIFEIIFHFYSWKSLSGYAIGYIG